MLFLSYAAYTAVQGFSWADETRTEGPPDLANPSWSDPTLFQWIGDLRPAALIYSNVPTLIYFNAGRSALELPIKYDPRTLLANGLYADQLAKIQTSLRDGNAALIYFPKAYGYWQPTDRDVRAMARRLPRYEGRIGYGVSRE